MWCETQRDIYIFIIISSYICKQSLFKALIFARNDKLNKFIYFLQIHLCRFTKLI